MQIPNNKHQSGKGSRYRPVDKKKYDENYERIFKKNSNKNKKFKLKAEFKETPIGEKGYICDDGKIRSIQIKEEG